MLTTDTHVFFVSGYLSNWFGCRFEMAPYEGAKPLEFNNSEQAFMLLKALHFGDFSAADKIMQSHDPKEQKLLGRSVRGYADEKWKAAARGYMFQATKPKFEQNSGLRRMLIATGERTIVEAAHYDTVWGVGLRESDPRILNESNWRGSNWLGENHMALRLHFSAPDQSTLD